MFKNCKILAIGANPNEYHAQTAKPGEKAFAVSSSSLRAFFACPSKWVNGWVLPPSASLEYGSLFDCIVLTPQLFDQTYTLQPSSYLSKVMKCPQCESVSDAKKCKACGVARVEGTIEKAWNNNSDTCDAWVEEQAKAGREVVSHGALTEAQTAAKRLLADEPIKRFLDACQRQVWLVGEWHDEETGLIVPVKCLIDLVSKEDSAFPKALGDLKTTKNAAPLAWASWAHKAGYEIQAAWNTDIFVAATKREITDFCFVLSENSAPFEPGRRYMSQDLLDPNQDMGDIASGRRQYKDMLRGYCKCLKTGKWPGFDDTDEASLSGWTLVSPNPFDEQRRLYAPKYAFGGEPPEPVEDDDQDPNGDIIP